MSAQIRALRADAYIRPNEAGRKVYLLERAHTMNPSAQNAMLKLLEEGPPYAAFLLLTENAAALLPTVRSRCETLTLSPVPLPEAGRLFSMPAIPSAAGRSSRPPPGGVRDCWGGPWPSWRERPPRFRLRDTALLLAQRLSPGTSWPWPSCASPWKSGSGTIWPPLWVRPCSSCGTRWSRAQAQDRKTIPSAALPAAALAAALLPPGHAGGHPGLGRAAHRLRLLCRRGPSGRVALRPPGRHPNGANYQIDEVPTMTEIIGVPASKAGANKHYFDPKGVQVQAGQGVIIKTSRGVEYGECVQANTMVEDSAVVQPLRPLVRIATPKDPRDRTAQP